MRILEFRGRRRNYLKARSAWIRGRQEVRARVEAEGLSDDEIDQLIGEARREANQMMREKPQP